MIAVTTVLLVGGLEVFRRPFLAPLGTPTGQLVLLGIGAGTVITGACASFASNSSYLGSPSASPSRQR